MLPHTSPNPRLTLKPLGSKGLQLHISTQLCLGSSLYLSPLEPRSPCFFHCPSGKQQYYKLQNTTMRPDTTQYNSIQSNTTQHNTTQTQTRHVNPTQHSRHNKRTKHNPTRHNTLQSDTLTSGTSSILPI